MESSILEIWNDIRDLVEGVDLDVRKNANGNSSAGLRARKALRVLKSKIALLTKASVNFDKSRKTDKVEKEV